MTATDASRSRVLPGAGSTRDVERVEGPLVVLRNAAGLGWDEVVHVHLATGERRLGLVLEVADDLAVVQVLQGTAGIDPADVQVTFEGHPFDVVVGESWLGRVWNGLGQPLDGGPPAVGQARAPVRGDAVNPFWREVPRDPVFTGVAVVDAITTFVRGQKLPVLSSAGLPHLTLVAQVATQAHAGGQPFAVVVAAMGLNHADSEALLTALEPRAAAGDLALFLEGADAPVIQRMLTPRVALTVAEHLAFDLGRHVLVVLADMTSYAEAVREVSSARGEIPGRRAYPSYLYSDLASIYERCGRIRGRPGSLTQLPVVTMPAGDITHPVADLTGYITEGQLILSSELHSKGVYPPVDVLGSLSRLMRRGTGEGRTRADHPAIAAQLVAALARSHQTRDLAELIGTAALTETDHRYLAFGDAFETRLVAQPPDRALSLEETLDRCWQVLSELPRRELTMMAEADLDRYLGRPADVGSGESHV